jgi:hypothetical protein
MAQAGRKESRGVRQAVVNPPAHLDDPNRADTFHGKVCFRTLGRYG